MPWWPATPDCYFTRVLQSSIRPGVFSLFFVTRALFPFFVLVIYCTSAADNLKVHNQGKIGRDNVDYSIIAARGYSDVSSRYTPDKLVEHAGTGSGMMLCWCWTDIDARMAPPPE